MAIYDVKKLQSLRNTILSMVIEDEKDKNNIDFPKLEILISKEVERKKIYDFVEKKCNNRYRKAFEVFLVDLKFALQFGLHNITDLQFRSNVTDNAIKAFCNIVEKKPHDFFFEEGKKDKQISFSLNQSETITSLFFEAYYNQLKKHDEDLDKYCGTYNFFAIKNLKKGQVNEIITQKTIKISKNEYGNLELIKNSNNYTYQGIAFKIRNYICLSVTKIDDKNIKNIQFIFFSVPTYNTKNLSFIQAAELAVNSEDVPTFRQVILQRIPIDREKNHKPTVYTLENLPTLFTKEKNIDIRLELEKQILYLLHKHSLGQSQIRVDFVFGVDSFLEDIPYYSKKHDFFTNLRNILDNKPTTKVKEEIFINKHSTIKLYKIVILKEYQLIEYEVTEYEEQIDLDTKESKNFFFENIDDIIFTSCWSKVDKRGYSCIIYNIDKYSFSQEDIGNMLLVIKKSVALTNYSVRTDFNRKLAKHVEYNSKQIENHKGNYINFFKCKDEKNNEMIGFNIISLDDNLTIKSRTRRNGVDSIYDGWWIPLSDIVEKKHGSSRASPVVEECQYNGVMLYTFHQDQYNEQRVLLGVGHYTLGKRNKDGNIIGCYSGMSIDDNIASGTDVFLKLYKNDILEAKELYPSSESYNFFNKLISDFDTSLLHNDEIKFSLKELLNHYNQI